MSGELKYTISHIGTGWVGILGSSRGLVRTTLPLPSAREAKRQLGDRLKGATRSDSSFAGLLKRLRSYFAGQRVSFNDRLDPLSASPFQRRVWEITRLIPYGETRSYGWIAGQLSKDGAARAVGRALGKNPLPVIIPCHRVVAKNGSLGGYSGGVGIKKELLKLEASKDKAVNAG
jgi:methylated-DNA-[protein]-cysteine S-methyltransferase